MRAGVRARPFEGAPTPWPWAPRTVARRRLRSPRDARWAPMVRHGRTGRTHGAGGLRGTRRGPRWCGMAGRDGPPTPVAPPGVLTVDQTVPRAPGGYRQRPGDTASARGIPPAPAGD